MMGVNSNQDWDDLGKNIQEIIDKAVNSKDFQKLNQAVSQIVERANNASSASAHPGPVSYNPPKYTRVHNYQTGTRSSQTYTKPQSSNLPAVYGSTGNKTAGGILKIVGGGILTCFSTVGLIGTVIASALFTGTSLIAPSALLTAACAGGAFLISNGIRNLTHVSRFKTYVKTIGQKTYCTFEQLSRSVQKPEKFVKKELQKMIDEGFFLEGHIDHEESCLITSDETYRHYEQCRAQTEEQQKQQATVEQSSSSVSSEVQEVLDKGEAFLRKIHKCNIDIPGEIITKKISHMELLIARIFERAESHPEIIPDLKKLMDYYLPMTVKLLTAYAEMDHQPIQGETILASKREIENTLDTLNTAFEKLLDSVFKETAMDVSSDISVLQTLLAQEGLAEDDLSKLRKEKPQN